MALRGRQKAAMLLMSLDAASAAELLKGVDSEVIRDLAVELEYLDVTGFRNSEQNTEIVRQFCDSLQARERFHLRGFFSTVLKNTIGEEKAEQIQTQIQKLLQKKDPVASISLALDLRNMDKDIRNGLLATIRERDSKVANIISDLMISWNAIPQVSDRSLQKALRGIDVKKLALSLLRGEGTIVQKITSNISNRTSVRLEKKTAAISHATIADIEEARKHIVKILRNMNIKGELTFVEDIDARYVDNQYYQEEIISTNSIKDQVGAIDR